MREGIADACGLEAVRLIVRVKKPLPACQAGRVLSPRARAMTAGAVSAGACWRTLADRPRSSALLERSAVGARHGCSWTLRPPCPAIADRCALVNDRPVAFRPYGGGGRRRPRRTNLSLAGRCSPPFPRTLGAGTRTAAFAHLGCIGGGSPPR